MKNDKKEKERDDSRDCLHARFVGKWDILLLNAGTATEEISPMEENEMLAARKEVTCFTCGTPGHITPDCPRDKNG